MKFCACFGVRSFGDAVKDIADELKECMEVKSVAELKDELSDVCWGVGRLLGGLVGRVYVHVPGDGAHYQKVMRRMDEYGCVRSKRLLVEGECPSK